MPFYCEYSRIIIIYANCRLSTFHAGGISYELLNLEYPSKMELPDISDCQMEGLICKSFN